VSGCSSARAVLQLICAHFRATPASVGTYLQDLTFIEDGNPDNFGSLVNMIKRKFLYGVTSELTQYQQVPYNLREERGVMSVLKTLPKPLPEGEKYRKSLALEPRGATKVSTAGRRWQWW